MINELDIHSLLTDLAIRRPIFHSEADLQHELAIALASRFPKANIRLEVPTPILGRYAAVDLLLQHDGHREVWELKYTKANRVTLWEGESFAGAAHRVVNAGYHFWQAVQRVQTLLKRNCVDTGRVLELSYAPLWAYRGSPNYINPFTIHEGAQRSGRLEWPASAGTSLNNGSMKNALEISGEVHVTWHHFSTLDSGGVEHKYLLVTC